MTNGKTVQFFESQVIVSNLILMDGTIKPLYVMLYYVIYPEL